MIGPSGAAAQLVAIGVRDGPGVPGWAGARVCTRG